MPKDLLNDKSTLITWTNLDQVLCRHMESLGANELKPSDVKYASMNKVIISSSNGLSPVHRQAITWTNADYCQHDPW